MQQVLLIVDGEVGRHFLQSILSTYYSNNFYVVLHQDQSLLPKEIPSTFRFYTCDYTSAFRLDELLTPYDISDAFVVLEDYKESLAVYKYLRATYKKARIVKKVYGLDSDCSELEKKDPNLVLISHTNSISLRLLSRLPNAPMIARGFGLEQGEVMEISVPSGSVFAHREVETIQQTNWKIVGIYRRGDFILASPQSIIMPGDTILAAGMPAVMQTIYHRIKSDMGQFPSPFGREIYLILDMHLQTHEQMLFDCREAIYLHKHLKSTHLTIKIINPTSFTAIREVDSLSQSDVSVIVDYENLNFVQTIKNKFNKKIGLIVVGREIFARKANRRVLWQSKIPVFKTAKRALSNEAYSHDIPRDKLYNQGRLHYPPLVSESLLAITGDTYEDYEIASVIFDVSKQLQLDVKVYDFEPDNHFSNEIVQHFNNIARIFERKFSIERSNSINPILYLRSLKTPILQFIPFKQSITRSRLLAYASAQFEALSFLVESNPQLFIPTIEEG